MLKIFVCIILFQFIELAGLRYIHGWIQSFSGSANATLITIISIFLTGFLGLKIAKHQGLSVLREVAQKTQANQPPTGALVEGVLILFGGIFLLIPGYISDFLGLCLLVPMIRKFLSQVCSGFFHTLFLKKFFNMTQNSHNHFGHFYYKRYSSSESSNYNKKNKI